MAPSPDGFIKTSSATLFLLRTSLRNDRSAHAFSPSDVQLSELNVYQPDILRVKRQETSRRQGAEGAPDLVVEVFRPKPPNSTKLKRPSMPDGGRNFGSDPELKQAQVYHFVAVRLLAFSKQELPSVAARVEDFSKRFSSNEPSSVPRSLRLPPRILRCVAVLRAGVQLPARSRRRSRAAGAATSAAADPLVSKPPHFPGTAKSVIWLFMEGGRVISISSIPNPKGGCRPAHARNLWPTLTAMARPTTH